MYQHQSHAAQALAPTTHSSFNVFLFIIGLNSDNGDALHLRRGSGHEEPPWIDILPNTQTRRQLRSLFLCLPDGLRTAILSNTNK